MWALLLRSISSVRFNDCDKGHLFTVKMSRSHESLDECPNFPTHELSSLPQTSHAVQMNWSVKPSCRQTQHSGFKWRTDVIKSLFWARLSEDLSVLACLFLQFPTSQFVSLETKIGSNNWKQEDETIAVRNDCRVRAAGGNEKLRCRCVMNWSHEN